jgi:hypothetical protein
MSVASGAHQVGSYMLAESSQMEAVMREQAQRPRYDPRAVAILEEAISMGVLPLFQVRHANRRVVPGAHR